MRRLNLPLNLVTVERFVTKPWNGGKNTEMLKLWDSNIVSLTLALTKITTVNGENTEDLKVIIQNHTWLQNNRKRFKEVTPDASEPLYSILPRTSKNAMNNWKTEARFSHSLFTLLTLTLNFIQLELTPFNWPRKNSLSVSGKKIGKNTQTWLPSSSSNSWREKR